MVTLTVADPRISYLKRYGSHSLAYAILQEGVDTYFEPGIGYVGFRPPDRLFSRPLVLDDPVCDIQAKRELLHSFLKANPKPIFLQISLDTAKALSEMGFQVNEFGVDTFIDVQQYELSGREKAHLRREAHGGQRDGLSIVELLDSSKVREQARSISHEWMQHRLARCMELRFLTRPAVYEKELDVRKFYAMQGDRMLGYVFFDPMYERGRIVGYLSNVERSVHDRSYSVIDCIILHALEVFKKEGVESLSLALSPLLGISDTGEFRYNSVLKFFLRMLQEHGDFLYGFNGHERHIKSYRPDLKGTREEKVYIALEGRFSLLTTYAVFRVLGMCPFQQLIKQALNLLAAPLSA